MKSFIGVSLAVVLSLGVVGCNNSSDRTTAVSGVESVDVSIAAVENSLTLALIGAKVYTDLPRCRDMGPRICSDVRVVRKIREYAIKAHDAVVMARRNQQLIGLAINVVAQFESVVPRN